MTTGRAKSGIARRAASKRGRKNPRAGAHKAAPKDRSRRALLESEQRYKQLFEIASDWFWETDAEGCLTYISPNVEAVLSLPMSAYIGKRLAATDGVIYDPATGRASLDAFKARRPYRDLVYARKLPDGRLIWVNSSGAPFYDADGTFLGYRGIAKDVTAQVEAQHALRKSEERLTQLLEASSDHYWEIDAQHRVTYISPNYEAVTGVPPSEIVGRRLDENPNVSIDPEMGKMALLAVKARQPYRDFVYSVKLADGTKCWISLSGTPVFTEDGSFRGYRGVGADITRRVEAEQVARLAQRQLHDAVSYVTQPFVVYDGAGIVVAFNQAFADLHRAPQVNTPVCHGVTFRELAEWQLRIGFYAGGAEDERVALDALLEGYESGREHAYHLRDGRWMLVVYRRLPGGGRVGLWTDVTEVKRVEAERRLLELQLHHSQRLEALGTLAGGVAHEVNNALVPVVALTKLVLAKLPEGSRERRNLDTVLIGAERSRDLVKQILAFSRKEEEQRPRGSIDVAEVVQEALRMMRASLPATIRIEEAIAPVARIHGDRGQLHQVLVNLMTNAAQAIGESQGTISVRLAPEPDGAHLRLSVVDTGCGMDEATRARIFEPFFTTKEVGKGTGLGLSVVHGIVKDHGGRIEVESTPGGGTRFHIVLPLAPAAAAGAAA